MLLVLNKNATKEQITEIEKKLQLSSKSGFDAEKYCGVLNLQDDALAIQMKLHNEWERNPDR